MDDNKRKRHRLKDRIPCNLEIVINDSIACKALDISEGGLYIHTNHNFDISNIMKVSLFLKNETLEVKARVKYCHKGIGAGLMFIDLDNSQKLKIKELIKDLEAHK